MILTSDNFKYGNLIEEYIQAPLMLEFLIDDFFHISDVIGRRAVCVRIFGKHPGDSGVHLDERAADFRDEFGGVFIYTKDEVEFIKKYINGKYKRNDGYETCIHHSFDNGPAHFHLQIPRDTKNLRKL